MCGINGFISFDDDLNLLDKLRLMNGMIIHRGPDSEGTFFERLDGFSIAMGMRRLSIIDLNTGDQPIFSEDKQKIIVFNGEIYNYKILRKELLNKGVVFKTNSDTEVILKLYEIEGAKSFSKLDGMFAFSIYDKSLGKVFIARDFFGEKPLYYMKSASGFMWSSELKSIVKTLKNKPKLNKTSLSLYFQLTYIPAPFTIYEEIHKLESNHYIELNCRINDLTINEIDSPSKKYVIQSKKETTKMVHDYVQKSVESRSVSDVPLGTFLSGGVDSSIVSLCLAKQSHSKIDTFSIGFEKKSFDESDKSRLVSNLINSRHHDFLISEKDLSLNIDEIILNFDEPYADSSALATYLVAKKTKEYVKVALTGDGGDEVFGGYNKYYMGKLNRKYVSFVPKKVHNSMNYLFANLLNTSEDKRGKRFKLRKLLSAINYENDFYYNIISLGFQELELNKILSKNFYQTDSLDYYKSLIGTNNSTLNDFRNIDRLLSLEGDLLVKVDRTSMLASLECRAPFLNKELWNFTNQIPEKYLINGWDKKHILKEAFKEYFPKNFLNKSKKGFGVPVGDWLKLSLKNELLSYTENNFLEKQGIFQIENIQKVVYNHINGVQDNTFRVWTYYCFQKWYNHNY